MFWANSCELLPRGRKSSRSFRICSMNSRVGSPILMSSCQARSPIPCVLQAHHKLLTFCSIWAAASCGLVWAVPSPTLLSGSFNATLFNGSDAFSFLILPRVDAALSLIHLSLAFKALFKGFTALSSPKSDRTSAAINRTCSLSSFNASTKGGTEDLPILIKALSSLRYV